MGSSVRFHCEGGLFATEGRAAVEGCAWRRDCRVLAVRGWARNGAVGWVLVVSPSNHLQDGGLAHRPETAGMRLWH